MTRIRENQAKQQLPPRLLFIVHQDEESKIYPTLIAALDSWNYGLKYSEKSWLEIITSKKIAHLIILR